MARLLIGSLHDIGPGALLHSYWRAEDGIDISANCFCENRDELGRLGLLYPDVSLRGFGHHDLAFLVSGGYPDWAAGQDRPLHMLAADLAAVARGH